MKAGLFGLLASALLAIPATAQAGEKVQATPAVKVSPAVVQTAQGSTADTQAQPVYYQRWGRGHWHGHHHHGHYHGGWGSYYRPYYGGYYGSYYRPYYGYGYSSYYPYYGYSSYYYPRYSFSFSYGYPGYWW